MSPSCRHVCHLHVINTLNWFQAFCDFIHMDSHLGHSFGQAGSPFFKSIIASIPQRQAGLNHDFISVIPGFVHSRHSNCWVLIFCFVSLTVGFSDPNRCFSNRLFCFLTLNHTGYTLQGYRNRVIKIKCQVLTWECLQSFLCLCPAHFSINKTNRCRQRATNRCLLDKCILLFLSVFLCFTENKICYWFPIVVV